MAVRVIRFVRLLDPLCGMFQTDTRICAPGTGPEVISSIKGSDMLPVPIGNVGLVGEREPGAGLFRAV